ncbi:MAG: tRNA pseudouridine(55) synthase TruB [Bacteroidia bacterium]|nr:tRNA pseudouridine(55) synthase TruB [Bacteroidia bacterium]
MSELHISEGGFLLIDKPLEWTSFDVVKKLRNISRIKKIGHAGTLDPLATGLLIVCYGRYTKKIESIQTQAKEYTGTFKIGETTESYDLEKEVNATFETKHITSEMLIEATHSFVGSIEQIPPKHSAVKIKGKRAYEYARSGKEVKMKSRIVDISEFSITTDSFPTVPFLVKCSKGTYIRSLARDFGEKLESGAHLTSLRRTKIGDYDVENAIAMSDIKSQEDFFNFAQQFKG